MTNKTEEQIAELEEYILANHINLNIGNQHRSPEQEISFQRGKAQGCVEALSIIKQLQDKLIGRKTGKTEDIIKNWDIEELREEYCVLMGVHNHFLNKPVYARAKELQEENKKLKEALQFYADQLNIGKDAYHYPTIIEHGEKAKQTLNLLTLLKQK